MYRMALNCGFDTEEEREEFRRQVVLFKGMVGAKNATQVITRLLKEFFANERNKLPINML